jgi:hypothetical protein
VSKKIDNQMHTILQAIQAQSAARSKASSIKSGRDTQISSVKEEPTFAKSPYSGTCVSGKPPGFPQDPKFEPRHLYTEPKFPNPPFGAAP